MSARSAESTDLTEQRRALARVLRAKLPAKRAAKIETLVRDTIAIVPRKAKKADGALGVSRLGGSPDLPLGMAWPTMKDGAVAFVAQIRLDELSPLDPHGRLPARGLLSFFAGALHNGEYGVEARVFHFPDAPNGLTPVDAPSRGQRRKIVGVDFACRALLPPHSSPLVSFEAPEDPYVDLFDAQYKLHSEDGSDDLLHGIFGFDRPLEEAQLPDEEILLRLDCDDIVPYDFVEAVCVYFFIPRAALARGDFTRVRLVEGASI